MSLVPDRMKRKREVDAEAEAVEDFGKRIKRIEAKLNDIKESSRSLRSTHSRSRIKSVFLLRL